MNLEDLQLITSGHDISIMGDEGEMDISSLLSAASGGLGGGLGSYDELDMLSVSGGNPSTLSKAMVQNAIAEKLAAASLLTRTDKPTVAREYPLGFESNGPVAVNAIVTVTTRPQVVFKAERLFIPSDIAGSFSVVDLIVGKNSQFAGQQFAIPGRIFDEKSVGIRLSMATAQISQDILLRVQNIGGAPLTFRAAITGPAVE